MHFTTSGHDHGTKMTKLAVVGLIHVALGFGVMHSIDSRQFALPVLDEPLELIPVTPVTPEPPETPPAPKPRTKPPITIPDPVVELPPVEPDVIRAEVQPEAPSDPGPAEPVAPADTGTSGASGAMRTAVLAEGCATPEYPARAARNGHEGTVRLALLVGADGRVQGSRIASSSGSRDLDRAAVNALSMCRFQPAFENGQAQAGWAQVEYVWRLED